MENKTNKTDTDKNKQRGKMSAAAQRPRVPLRTENSSVKTFHETVPSGAHRAQIKNNTQPQPNTSHSPQMKTQPQPNPSQSARMKTQPQPNSTRLSAGEREQIIAQERKKVAALRKNRRDTALAYLILTAIAFVIISLIFAAAFYINLVAHKKPDNDDYSLVLSDYTSALTVNRGSVVAENGNRYVNFSQIAEFYGFAMVGSIDDMKYVVKGDESETISFAVDSDRAYINGVQVKMPGKAYYIDGDLYVDEEFITNYINGLSYDTDTDKKQLSFSRIILNPLDSEGKIADGKPPQYEEISFKLKAPAVSVSIAEDDTAVVMPTFDFNSELSAYEEFMNPGSTTEFLTFVSADHRLSEDYIPTGLSLLGVGNGMYLKEYAAKSFAALYKEATACGITGLTVTRAYVSYDELLKAYNDTVDKYTPLLGAEQAKRYANATSPVPGADEHQLGLTVDFAMTSGAEFSSSTAYAWLCDNSYKFGFIQRYPSGKSSSDDYTRSYNQFRYVGRYHAVRINALGLSLDDYCEYLGL